MVELCKTISNVVGISGVCLILTGYYLINTSRVTSQHLSYLCLNFFGAWLILFSLFFHWNLASVMIELAWILISLIGFYRLTKKTAS